MEKTQVSELAVMAMLSLTNFDCITLKVRTRPMGNQKYSVLYAFKRRIAVHYPATRSVVISNGGVTVTAVVNSVLNKIPGVTITRTGDNVITLNGTPWDGRRQTVPLPEKLCV